MQKGFHALMEFLDFTNRILAWPEEGFSGNIQIIGVFWTLNSEYYKILYINIFTYYRNIYIYGMDISSQIYPVAYAGGWSFSWFFTTALTFSFVYISICLMILKCVSYLFWLTSAPPRFGVLPIGARIAPRWVKNMWLSVPWMFLFRWCGFI